MAVKTRYFVRIKTGLSVELATYLDEGFFEYTHISNDMGKEPSVIYSVLMDEEEALALRLKFPLVGFLSFGKIFKKSVA
jgi:hypothetical protein